MFSEVEPARRRVRPDRVALSRYSQPRL